MINRVVLFTDFGAEGPYTAQIRMVLSDLAPTAEVVDLLSNAPSMRPKSAAYLLAALAGVVPSNSLFLAVVDPGVGGSRHGLIVRAGQQWFVGPDNGLLAVIAARSHDCESWRITWQPAQLSSSFHGRDLFAPVAAMLIRGDDIPGVQIEPSSMVGFEWQADLTEIIYIDHYGNAFTGVRAESIDAGAILDIGGQVVTKAMTFSDVDPGAPFWYENSCGLVEIAVNQGRADQLLSLRVGDAVNFEKVVCS